MDGVRVNLPTTNLPSPDIAKSLARPANPADSASAARKFESLLGAMLVKEMRSTLSSGFFGKGAGNDVYGGWLDEHVGESLASRDALHLEGALKESLERKARKAGEQS
jgi:Rod binding domain-containing protein